jgi:hypothetical protein
MKKISFFTIVTVMTLICMSFTKEPRNAVSNQIMLYGVAYNKQCNSDAFRAYSTKKIDINDFIEEKVKMESYLENGYPNSSRIRVSSSKYDFGESATNMCIIKWTKKSNDCYYSVLYVAFGTSHQDALNSAIKQKDSYGGQNAEYSIVTNEYW